MKSQVLLKLGPLAFRAQTAAFAEIQRSTEWAWEDQTRIGGTPALQYTGKGTQTITLPCVIYPAATDGHGATPGGCVDALNNLHFAGDAATPLLLVDGHGTNHGMWVIKSISETYSSLLADGAPRKVEFTLTLAKYADAERKKK